MEMLEYCKTYNIMKTNLANVGTTDIASQSGSLVNINHQTERSFSRNGDIVGIGASVEDGELAVYRSLTGLPEDLNSEENKLNPLRDIKRSKSMVSTVKPQQRVSFESELTFAPKLNALSIKLAKERGDKIQAALNRRAAALHAETESNFTFKPKVSSHSVKIMQNMKTSFLGRQQKHVEKQRKHVGNLVAAFQSKTRLSPVNLSKSPSKAKSLYKSGTAQEERDMQDRPSTGSLPSSMSASNLTDKCVPEIQVSDTDVSDPNELHSPSISSSIHEISPTTSNTKLGQISDGLRRLQESSPYNQSVESLYVKRNKKNIRAAHKRGLTHPSTKPVAENDGWNNSTKVDGIIVNNKSTRTSHSRTTSQPTLYCGKMKYDDPLFGKARHAKEVAETAIKDKKVFICHGSYPIVRATLRRRGWVEKHFKGSLISKKARKNKDYDSDDDSCDSGDDSDNDSPSANAYPRGKENSKSINKDVKNKQETNAKGGGAQKDDSGSGDSESDDDDMDDDDEDWKAGYEDGPNCEFNLMSRMVRNAVPSLIWTVKRDDIDFKFLRKDQMVNHYCRAHSFTTKVGLCVNLRNLMWYENMNPNTFFPRCHRLGSEEDKMDFIDDFHLTSAVGIIMWVVQRYENGCNPRSTSSKQGDGDKSKDPAGEDNDIDRSSTTSAENVLPVKALSLALEACQEFLQCKEHLDIDDSSSTSSSITDAMWDQIIESSYQLRAGAVIASAFPFVRECQSTLNLMRAHLPQVDIDGIRNVWIVKPGAKSRGRGIMCMDRLDDILKLSGNIVGQKEGRWVVQKYIERPLLIYGVKFDIRQWFLVTDWNPLTMWFYEDCYLRFCGQNFSLEDFHVSIHLANNSIQKNFDINSTRDKRLPEENMWSSDDFKAYLKKRNLGNIWSSVVYPGMKQAVIHALQSCQEVVECRKNSFELYGADFIIADDYKPWLIEINCSPTMGPSTAVTRKLCAAVLEDTMKVVLDRREDKNCGTGSFELAYKQAHISAPPYIGINMSVEGQGISRKPVVRRQVSSAKLTTLSRPQENKKVLQTTQDPPEAKRDFPTALATSGRTTFVKKSEGAWAMGCISTSKKSAPVHAPSHGARPKDDEKVVKKLVTKGKPGVQVTTAQNQRISRAMTIPKAVLRYSSDSGIQQRTQLPISIGPDTRGKAF